MKRVVSLSLGSSKRDKTVTVDLLGETFEVSRIGVDGDQGKFQQKLAELDGTVDAIGFGGMDRYLWSNGKRYEFAAARALLQAAKQTPVLDGSGLKNTLERETIRFLQQEKIVDFSGAKTLMVCGVDRFGMSEALVAQGGEVIFGDLMFSLDLPIALSAAAHRRVAPLLLPVAVRLPLSLLYPMGEKQEKITPKWEKWYRRADIIAGDFHYIHRYMPSAESGALQGKIIITNTVTEENIAEFAARGVRLVVTSTPNFDGRSFGTNVMEAMLTAKNNGHELTPIEYEALLRDLDWKPTLRHVKEKAVSVG